MTSTALELVQADEANGGCLQVEDVDLVIAPSEAPRPVVEALRANKSAIIALVQSGSGKQADFEQDEFPLFSDCPIMPVGVRLIR